jgi:type IV pilus assembly protein PilA
MWRMWLCGCLLFGCALVKGPPKDGECRANLRTALSLQLSLKDNAQRFSEHPAEVGFAPTSGNRYLYLFSATGPVSRRDGQTSPPVDESVGIGPDTIKRGVKTEWLRDRLPPDVAEQLGVRGVCPDCDITIACVGNIDDDETVDVWSISSVDRPNGPRGTAIRHVNDRER